MDRNNEIKFSGEYDEKVLKEKIYSKIQDKIRTIVISETDPEKRWGGIYELFVSEELSEKFIKTETEIESTFREILEYMYTKADLFTGKNKKKHAGRPDRLKVGFKDERIFIEVVEIKSSYYAYEHGRDNDQPRRTLESLISLVKIINLLSEGKGNMWILNEFPEFPKELQNDWKKEINAIRSKLQKKRAALGKDIPSIDISKTIDYRIITPSDEKMNGFESCIIQDREKMHSISITNEKALLSKKELYQIITHHQEQISP